MGAEVEGGGQLPSSSRVIRFHGVPSPTLLPQRSTRWWWYIDLIYSNIRLQVHVGDNFPMSSRVGRLHRRPDSRCLHSDQHIFDRDHKSKGFQLFFIAMGTGRERGGIIPTESSCNRRFHDGPASDFLHNRRLSRVSHAGGTGYGPLPCLTHIEIKNNDTHPYVLNVRWLPRRRLNTFWACEYKSTCFNPAYAHPTDSRRA